MKVRGIKGKSQSTRRQRFIARGMQFPSQESTNIYLEAGRRYYVEALHSAGTGDDSFAVGWKLPDGTLEQPIPSFRLNPFGMAPSGIPA